MLEKITRDPSSNSHASYSFFKEKYDEFKPLKKLTVFFDSENFLTTPYTVEGKFVHMVLENWGGQELHINNLNSGYGGEGPSETARLLKYIGMEENKAECLKYEDGLQIGFSKDGKIDDYDIKTNVFFAGNVRKGKYRFDIDDYSYIDISRRKIYFLNPQLTNFKGLLNSIDIMKPREIEYYIGKESPLENFFRFDDDFKMFRGNMVNFNYLKIKGADDVNLIIRGELFDIICLIKKSDLMTIINVIYLYLFQDNLFKIKLLGNYTTLTSINDCNIVSIIKYYLTRIFNRKETSIHEVIKIDTDNEEMKKWKLQL